MSNRTTITLCMIVLNEADYLDRALANVRLFVDEIVVVDGGSTDTTTNIAQLYGAIVIHSPWNHDFATQRNVSLTHATKDWILVLDADETFEPRLLDKLQDWAANHEQIDSYIFSRKNYLDGLRIDAKDRKDKQLRFFKKSSKVRYRGRVHEVLIGTTKSKEVVDYAISHNKSADRQARQSAYYRQLLGPWGVIVQRVRITIARLSGQL